MQLPSMTYLSEPGPLLDTSIQTHVAFLSDQVALIEPRRRVSRARIFMKGSRGATYDSHIYSLFPQLPGQV